MADQLCAKCGDLTYVEPELEWNDGDVCWPCLGQETADLRKQLAELRAEYEDRQREAAACSQIMREKMDECVESKEEATELRGRLENHEDCDNATCWSCRHHTPDAPDDWCDRCQNVPKATESEPEPDYSDQRAERESEIERLDDGWEVKWEAHCGRHRKVENSLRAKLALAVDAIALARGMILTQDEPRKIYDLLGEFLAELQVEGLPARSSSDDILAERKKTCHSTSAPTKS